MPPYIMTGVALVTGAASGIGRATAFAFADEGVTQIALVDINESGLQKLSSEFKSQYPDVQIKTVSVDTSSPEAAQRLVDETVAAFGAINYCVNCAGISSQKRVPSTELSLEMWDEVIGVNLRGVWMCMKAEISQMLKQPADLQTKTGAPPQRGAIVNISSLAGRLGIGTAGSYSAAKHGVLGISRTDASVYGKDGIRVNSICPGVIATPLVESAQKRGAKYYEAIDKLAIPRLGLPEEIAQTCVFLASTRASYITGEEVCVDGGWLHCI